MLLESHIVNFVIIPSQRRRSSSLLSTVNIFRTLFRCFHCQLETSKYRQGSYSENKKKTVTSRQEGEYEMLNRCTKLKFTKAATRTVLYKKVFLEISQNSQENTSARASFLIKLQALDLNFIKKETLPEVFSCEFCEISKNTFFTEHLWTTASKFVNIKC